MHESEVQSGAILPLVVASQTSAFSLAYYESGLSERRRPQTYRVRFWLTWNEESSFICLQMVEVHGDFELGLKVINRKIFDDKN